MIEFNLKRMKYNFKIIVLIFLNFSVSLIAQERKNGKVVSIKDGDTVIVIDSLKNQYTLRLAEIDCPEKNQPFGNKAKQYTSDQIYLKTIDYVIIDSDNYGRLIAKIYYNNGKYLSEELIKCGLAWHYKKYSSSEKLTVLELQAREGKIGIWSEENAIPPSEFRDKTR